MRLSGFIMFCLRYFRKVTNNSHNNLLKTKTDRGKVLKFNLASASSCGQLVYNLSFVYTILDRLWINCIHSIHKMPQAFKVNT